MESKFKPKVGQLVSWNINNTGKEHIGIITKVLNNSSVEVTFNLNDWVIIIDPCHLNLLNDID